MFRRDRLGISKPPADDVQRVSLHKFRLARATAILKGLLPAIEPGPLHDATKLSPHVVGSLIFRDDRLGFDARLPSFDENIPQLGKERNHATLAVAMMFRFRARHLDASRFPVDVTPAKREHFGRAPQPAEPAEPENRTPLEIRTCREHLVRNLARHEKIPRHVRHDGRLQIAKRVLTQ
ncbi:MAG: hypothetical protein WEB58_13640 [Planctomycetaceae bacterium]